MQCFIDALSTLNALTVIVVLLGAAITFILLRFMPPAASKRPEDNVRHAVEARRTDIPAESREFWVEISEALKDGVPDGITFLTKDYPRIDQMMSYAKPYGDQTCTRAVQHFLDEILRPENTPKDNHLSYLSDPAIQNELRKLAMKFGKR